MAKSIEDVLYPKIGKDGVERVIELELEPTELESLQGSGAFYREQLGSIMGY